MPPKRGNTKAKAENVAEADSNDIPAKKKAGKVAKVIEKAVSEENNGEEEATKNGSTKRGRKPRDVGNGDGNDAERQEPAKSSEEPKVPAKRGRKPKEAPPAKKPKSEDDSEPDNDADVAEDEPEAKPKRGRKPADKKEPIGKVPSEPKVRNVKGKKAKEAEAEEPEDVEEPAEEVEPESKPAAKRGRGAPKKVAPKESEDNDEPTEKAPKKRGANKAAADEPPPKRKPVKALLNKVATDYSSNDFSCSSTTPSGKPWNFKISSWNVDGIRAWANKGGLEYINHEKPDILCLQETKCSQDKLPSEVASIPGYHPYWLSGEQDGYAGVGIYTKKMAISVTYGLGDPSLDNEGRIITAEYEQFYLVSTYVPNAGRKLITLPKRLQWNEIFRKYVKDLDAKKPVIICGDMNVSHLEIDLANPKSNKKNAGFTQEERDGMTDLLSDGFVDTFRNLYPDRTDAYTFWTYMSNCRAKNVGWRLDYAIVSERLIPAICDNVIRSQVFGSDHCPITLFLHLNGLEKLADEN